MKVQTITQRQMDVVLYLAKRGGQVALPPLIPIKNLHASTFRILADCGLANWDGWSQPVLLTNHGKAVALCIQGERK